MLLQNALQWIIAISLVLVANISNAADQTQIGKNSRAVQPGTRPAVIYKAPLHDDTGTGETGSTRITDGKAAEILLLVPEHIGLTTQAQPTLYWYTHNPMAVSFKLFMNKEDGIDTLLEIRTGNNKVAGIQQLDLGDHKISLQPEVTYQWTVTTVTENASELTGVIANGLIERFEPGEGLTHRIERSEGIDLVTVYAYEGIWYDALETISSMIEKSPKDQSLVTIRASLLDQVGLGEVHD
jgi:hypothetical protein